MILRKLFYIAITFSVFLDVQAQDAEFSQYYSSELYLNPAMAGEEQDITFSSNYRQQWKSIVLPYTTSQFSIVIPYYDHTASENHKGGFGVSVYNDRAGESNFRTTGINITAAYNLPLTLDYSHNLSFGMQAGLIQKSIDYSDLEWGEQYNPFIGFDASITPSEDQLRSATLYPDFSAGLMYYYNYQQDFHERKVSAFLGGAVYHLNTPNESFVGGETSLLPRLYKFSAGINIPINDKFHISPNALYLYQHENDHVNLGLYLTYQVFGSTNNMLDKAELILGTWYRVDDSFIFSAGIHQKAWTLGFSYDYNNSSLRYETRGQGAYEISLRIRRVKERLIKKIATPRI